MRTFDYIVVGSGASGSMAAQTLVEAGKQVAILDVGVTNQNYHDQVPKKDYLTIRQTDTEQYKYLIGKNAEGLTWGDIGKGAQVTPPRKHLTEKVDTYMPLDSDTFFPIESLGYGGLGIGWGLQCWEFSRPDIASAGMNAQDIVNAYEVISERIGVSATKDSGSMYTMGELQTFQPSPKMDRNHQAIYRKYQAREKAFNKQGFFMGRTPLALLTQDKEHRKKYAYHDMDFYTDNHLSAWRPWVTVDQLKKHDNFTYIGGHLVVSFVEKDGFVEVQCLTVPEHKTVVLRCKKLILAANPLSSGRIALRSLSGSRSDTKLPILCNPYTYIPCLQPALVGKAAEPQKMGFAQLTLFLDELKDNTGISVASLYSYQSLMLFRIIRQLPFNFDDARTIMRYLMSGLEIMGVHHPDSRSDDKFMQLIKTPSTITGDTLKVNYELDDTTKQELERREKKFIGAARKMGVYSLKRINPGYGSSVHYAGTLPYSDKEEPFTLDYTGRLRGTKNVFVADSSGFTYLPARGLTFTLLANAHVTAERILHHG